MTNEHPTDPRIEAELLRRRQLAQQQAIQQQIHYLMRVPPGHEIRPIKSVTKGTLVIAAAIIIAGALIASAVLISPINASSSRDVDIGELKASTLLLPEENSVVESDEIMLYWAPVLGADSYILVVGGGSSSFYLNTTTERTYYSVSGLSNGETYWWEVAAVKDGRYGPFSSYWPFTVNTKLDAPSSYSPKSGSVLIDVAPALRWTSVNGADEYRVQISENPNYSGLIVDVLTPMTNYQPDVKMLNGTTYYWRVMAHQGGIWSDWGETSSFFISPAMLQYTQTWNYSAYGNEAARDYTVRVDIQAEDYYAYRAIKRIDDQNLQGYSIYVTPNDPVIKEIATQLKIIATSKGYNQYEAANFVLSFVQDIPYELDRESIGLDNYPRYPVETLIDGAGDCEDVAALFASLIKSPSFNMDAVLVYLTNEMTGHMAVGLNFGLPADPIVATWTYACKVYYYCEATCASPIGFPTDASRWSYVIIPL